MIAFLTLLYVGALAILTKLRILPNTPVTWASTIVWVVLLFVVLFIPMQWGAPAGPVRMMVPTVQIIPNVSGPVVTVDVEANRPIGEGDVLFTIDPAPYEAALREVEARLKFEELRLEQFSQLASRDAGTRFQVEQTRAMVDSLRAQAETAAWNLRETTVRAPSDGYVTFLALRPGQRVTSMPFQPAMTFFDLGEAMLGLQLQQIYMRHVEVGQPVEVTFKRLPGRVFSARVEAIISVTAEAQAVIRGTVPQAQQVRAEPFFVRLELDADDALSQLPPGSVGTAAIYTDSASPTHIIRKVMLRMTAITNYILPNL